MSRLLISILVILSSGTLIWAQTARLKTVFGNHVPSEFDLVKCAFDTTATAYYLFDSGSAGIITNPQGLRVEFTRHFAIKLLDSFPPDANKVYLSLYQSPASSEELKDLRASTFNVTDDIIYENKLDKTSIKYSSNGYYQDMEITLPNVHEGSILEVQYTIESDYLTNFHGWDFQRALPVLKSQYETTIPDFITYPVYAWGDDSIKIVSDFYKSLIDGYEALVTTYSSTNVPAYIQYPFVLYPNTFRRRLEFELAPNPDQSIDYTSNWPNANKYLYNHPYFGNQLLKSGLFKNLKKEFLSNDKTRADTLQDAYHFIQSQIKWDGGYGIYASDHLNKIISRHTGNVADINLVLVGLLRALDYRAYPVVLTTSNNGKLIQEFPTLSKLNYVVVAVFSGGKINLMDASDPYGNSFSLSPQCVHTAGVLINEREGFWIELNANKLGQTQINYQLHLDTSENLTGEYTERLYSYAAYKMRSELIDSNGIDYYFDYLEKNHPGITFTNRKVEGFNDREKELSISSIIHIETEKDTVGNHLSFGPGLLDVLTANPFQAITRNVPIQYSYPWMITTNIEINFSQSYSLDSIPASSLIQADDKTIKYTMVCEDGIKGQLKINTLLSVNKTEFLPEEYQGVKSLFQHIVDKHRERVRLKKNN
ncbi:MAG: hypothetical protein IPJ09_19320 [Saprospiraceae bacterium]|nr:hypothetical protein [Saprospiraceae bacterium]